MAIDLPPTLPPQTAALATVNQYASGAVPVVGKVGSYEVRVTGDHHLSAPQLEKIFSVTNTPTTAVKLINSAIVRNGHLLVTLFYAPQGRVIHVHAVQGVVKSVEGESGVKGLFQGLVGDADLTYGEFDRVRVNAGLQASRASKTYTASYSFSQDDPTAVTMNVATEGDAESDQADLIIGLSNGGNRFAGRYMADVGVNVYFDNGIGIQARYDTSLSELGESFEGDDYHRGYFRLDKSTKIGLLGLEYSQAEYTQPITTITPAVVVAGIEVTPESRVTVDYDAEIERMALFGEHVLSSSATSRFILKEKVEHIDMEKYDDSTGTPTLLDEEYTTLEIGAYYHKNSSLGGNSFLWSLGMAARGGLGNDKGTLGQAEQNTAGNSPLFPQLRTSEFLMVRPEAYFKWSFGNSGWALSGNVIGQIADERLPEQQQWVLGGANTISAYLPGVMVGDSGYFTSGSVSKEWKTESGSKYTISGFVEYGTSWYEDFQSDDFDQTDLEIADAGIRFAAQIGKVFTIDAVAADSFMEEGFADSDDDSINTDFLDRAKADFIMNLRMTF